MILERPILYTGEMVSQILADRKTKTRRLVKAGDWKHFCALNGLGNAVFTDDEVTYKEVRCPYGQVGDRLWVRETWGYELDATFAGLRRTGIPLSYEIERVYYQAGDGWDGPWIPSIHMPRWASRITLEITEVRVERLNAITRDDAIAEGVDWHKCPQFQTEAQMSRMIRGGGCSTTIDYVGGFHRLWDSINGKKAPWVSNPWVWVISFKRLEGPKVNHG